MIIYDNCLENIGKSHLKIICFVSAHFLDCCIDKSDVSTPTPTLARTDERLTFRWTANFFPKVPNLLANAVYTCSIMFMRQVLKVLEPPVCPRPATRIASLAFGFASRRAVEMEWIAPRLEAFEAFEFSSWSTTLLFRAKAHSATFVNHKGRLRSQRRLRTVGAQNLRQFQTRVN